EEHAAECATCGPLLDRASAVGTLPTELSAPSVLRDRTMAAVRAQGQSTRRRRAVVSIAAVAAIVGLALFGHPPEKSASACKCASRVLFAQVQARPEFDALDVAERELLAAMTAAPQDSSLALALARLQRQRSALRQLVQSASQ